MGNNVIAVIDSSTHTVDIITVPESVLAEYDGVESYLIEYCGYDPENIQWDDTILSVDHYKHGEVRQG